jgi:hypothetical protein
VCKRLVDSLGRHLASLTVPARPARLGVARAKVDEPQGRVTCGTPLLDSVATPHGHRQLQEPPHLGVVSAIVGYLA